MRKIIESTFTELASEYFSFLGESGFAGPKLYKSKSVAMPSPGISYNSPSLTIDIGYDPHEDRVVTHIRRKMDKNYIVAGLSCLYTTFGLGPAQNIKERALTSHALSQVLQSQSKALEKLLPKLEGPTANEILNVCHGR